MEGLAVNTLYKKFYVLREHNDSFKNRKTLIYTYSIDSATTREISLKYESVVAIPLEPHERYSDLCLDAAGNKLLCLKTRYDGTPQSKRYKLVSLDLDKGRITGIETLIDSSITPVTLSYENRRERYSSNLEGIICDTNADLYIVSDNANGKANCIEPSERYTLILRSRMNF